MPMPPTGWQVDVHETRERGHGRIEIRRPVLDLTAVEQLPQAADWPDLKMIAMVQSERQVNGKTTVEERFYTQPMPLFRFSLPDNGEVLRQQRAQLMVICAGVAKKGFTGRFEF